MRTGVNIANKLGMNLMEFGRVRNSHQHYRTLCTEPPSTDPLHISLLLSGQARPELVFAGFYHFLQRDLSARPGTFG